MFKKDNNILALILISVVFLLWWLPYFLKGWLPLAEWGYGLIWGDWLSDRFWMVTNHLIPQWNSSNVLGVNYIGRDPFNNPLSLGNFLKFVIHDPKAEWVLAIFLNILVLGIGTYRFLLSQNIERKFALLGTALITFYPKWMEDVGHGPGKFITAYCVVPWAMLLIYRMFENKPKLLHFVVLGIMGAVIFLGSGAWVSVLLAYLLIPYFIYKFVSFLKKNNLNRDKTIIQVIFGVSVTFIVALGLSAYLLLPLLDNLKLSSRSLYAPAAGYGLKDLTGMFFPWLSRLYSFGAYDRPIPFPVVGLISNIRFYFGILAVPLFVYTILNKKLRSNYKFFWLWPLITILLFSHAANKFFPLVSTVERMLGAQSSENFIFFPMIFCFNLILVASLKNLFSKSGESFNKNFHSDLKITHIIAKVLMYFYALVIFVWLSIWFLMHKFVPILNQFLTSSLFNDQRNYLILQIMSYSYFYDKFFIIYLISFIVRFIILWWFVSGYFVKKRFGLIILSVLMVFDFMLFPKLYYTFNPSLDLRYSESLEQNAFIYNKVKPDERIASFHPSQKLILKSNNYKEFAKNKYLLKKEWNPRKIFNDYSQFNPDLGYYEPLFDIGLTYYPVTVGKQIYNYHESFFPEYFYDFDKAMNEGDRNYSRQSWIALWDPKSHLVDVAGISYIFWFEPIEDKRLSLIGIYPRGKGFIYKNNQAAPKAYLVQNLEYFSDREILLNRIKSPDFNLLNAATTEDKELASKFITKEDDLIKGSVKVSRYSTNRIELEVDAKKRSLLVLTDLFFPYWTAKIDDKPAEIYRVNCVFRGILVDRDSRKVVLQYRNPKFYNGLRITFLTLILTVLYIILSLFSKRKKEAF